MSACSNSNEEHETETIDLEQNGSFLEEFCETDGEFDFSNQTMTSRRFFLGICFQTGKIMPINQT